VLGHEPAQLLYRRAEFAGRSSWSVFGPRRGGAALALVSVYGAVQPCGTLGFAMRELPGLAAKLGPYGAEARYTVSDLCGPG
jgi:hypothetical protein